MNSVGVRKANTVLYIFTYSIVMDENLKRKKVEQNIEQAKFITVKS